MQLISVRTVLEEERQRRVRAERDLSISIDVLNVSMVNLQCILPNFSCLHAFIDA